MKKLLNILSAFSIFSVAVIPAMAMSKNSENTINNKTSIADFKFESSDLMLDAKDANTTTDIDTMLF